MPFDPTTGRILPYTFGGNLPQGFIQPQARQRVVKRLRPDLLTGQRGGGLTLADILRSATGLGSQLFGGSLGSAGGGLADVLRGREAPQVAPAAPASPLAATGPPFVDVDETTAALEAPIASLNTPDQAVARDLARMVEEGKITMQEAAQRYRQYRFGGP